MFHSLTCRRKKLLFLAAPFCDVYKTEAARPPEKLLWVIQRYHCIHILYRWRTVYHRSGASDMATVLAGTGAQWCFSVFNVHVFLSRFRRPVSRSFEIVRVFLLKGRWEVGPVAEATASAGVLHISEGLFFSHAFATVCVLLPTSDDNTALAAFSRHHTPLLTAGPLTVKQSISLVIRSHNSKPAAATSAMGQTDGCPTVAQALST